jgi:hypothetical protein
VTPLETATFRPDDPELCIATSLDCPRCCSSEVERELGPSPHDPVVACRCSTCGFARDVVLEPWQYVRLALIGRRRFDRTWPADAYNAPVVW